MRVLSLLLVVLVSGCMFDEEDPDDGITVPPDVCGDGRRTGSELCDDGNLIDGDGCSSSCGRLTSLQIHWQTSTLAGAVHTCPAGFDLASVILQPVLDSGVPDGAPLAPYTVDCSDGVAQVDVTPRAYQASIRFAQQSTGEVYGQTLPQRATSGMTVTMYTDAGYSKVTWSLVDANGQARDCQQTLVDYITATFTPAGGGAAITNAFHCATGTVITPPLPAGTYDLTLSARQHSSTITGVVIDPRSALTDPGPIEITIPAGT